jgi:hypothetical protein
MPTRCASLLDHGNRDLAQLLGEPGLVLEELHEANRAGEAGRPAADDRHADLDPIFLGIGRRADELLGRVDGRRVVGRRYGH